MQPPADWDDLDAWDRFHAQTPMGDRIDAARRALRYVPDLEAAQLKQIWFPGCGTSLAPRAYSELGFNVVASDLSREALNAQWQSSVGVSAHLLGVLYEQAVSGLAPERGGKLDVVKHDLAEPFERDGLSAVLNIYAFAGFDDETKRAIAASHLKALDPGGWAIFQVAGAANNLRDAMEDLLLEAGFAMPLNACERWYRRELDDTGLPISFRLGRPRVDSEQGYEEQAGDQDRLDAIEKAYLERRRAQRDKEGALDKDARLAFTLYD